MMSLLCRFIWVVQSLDKVVDMPVIVNDSVCKQWNCLILHRRQRQWHVAPGFAGFAFRAAFSTIAVRCGMPVYFFFDSGIQFGRANAVFSCFRLTTMMKVLVMTTTIGPGAARRLWGNRVGNTACAMLSRSWPRATDHGETVKLIQL